MPLTDIVRHLNAQVQFQSRIPPPFYASCGQVFIRYGGLQLGSRFSPLVETSSGRTPGYSTSLLAFNASSGRPVPARTVFVLPCDDQEFIHLDRLVRTLHALNYLAHRLKGWLLIRVHPRHVAAVAADHGLAFEEILGACGLRPEQVSLELDTCTPDSREHLIRAAANYRQRGYNLAIHRFDGNDRDVALLHQLQPELVRPDRLLLQSSNACPPALDRIHALGAKALLRRSDLREAAFPADGSGADWLEQD